MLNPYQKSHLQFQKPDAFQKFSKPSIVAAFENCVGEQRLRKSGSAILTNCPFHDDKNPSFAMYQKTDSYFCFSCGATGDSFTLIMKLLQMDFKQAVEYSKNL